MNKLLLLFVSLCLLLTGCDEENEYESCRSDGLASLCFYVSDRGDFEAVSSRGSVFDTTPEESKIEDLVVLCYERADGNLGKYIGYNKINTANVLNKGMLGNCELKQVDWNKSDFTPQADCDILILANCIDNGLALVYIDSIAKEAKNIHELQYRLKVGCDILNKPSSLIMSAYGTYSVKSGAVISLERIAAKVRIALSAKLIQQGYEIESVAWVSWCDSTCVLNQGSTFPQILESGVSDSWANVQKDVAQGYAYEISAAKKEDCLGSILGLKVGGVTSYYRLNINERNGHQKIVRNNLYQIDLVSVNGFGADNPYDAIDGVFSSKLGVHSDEWDDPVDVFYLNAENGVGVALSHLSIDKKFVDLSLNNGAVDTILVYWVDSTSLEKTKNDFTLTVYDKNVALSKGRSEYWSIPDSIYLKYGEGSINSVVTFGYKDVTVRVPVKVESVAIGAVVVGNVIFSPDPGKDQGGEVYFPAEMSESFYNRFCPAGWRIPHTTELNQEFVQRVVLNSFDGCPVLIAKDESARIVLDLGKYEIATSALVKVKDQCYFMVYDESTSTCKVLRYGGALVQYLDSNGVPDLTKYTYPVRCVRPIN